MTSVLESTASTGADITRQISELAPGFRARIAATEAQRSVSRASIDELRDAGAARLLVPREHGGLDLSVRVLVDVVAAAASGCPSTGWVTGLMAHAAHVLGRFPRETQDAVWASGPDVIVASSFAGAKAEVVPGGYRLSGASPFASGVNNADWVYLGGMVARPGQPPLMRLFALPKGHYTVVDSWNTVGMRGTGSNTIVTDDVFVPEEFSLAHDDAREGTTPGSQINAHHTFALPWVATGALTFAAAMLGAAEGAYVDTVASVKKKRLPGGRRTAESETLQMQVSAAAARITAARRTLEALADRADAGLGWTLEERAGAMRDGSFAAAMTVEAIDALLEISGTGGFGSTSFVQQAWRDIHFAAAHQGLNPRVTGGRFGRLALEVEETQPPVFF
jgi:3-hydroxy-9,10-secoandrosta-1,3,5(10)-triene-9,17-dione monooxygenase